MLARVLSQLLLSAALAITPSIGSKSGTLLSESPAQFDGPAELPRVYVRSSLADTPAPGKTWKVKSGNDLQASLNRAGCGDTIALEAGAEFTGRFTLPAKSCDDDHWIIIRTSAPDSVLPPEGSRITPCYAGVGSLPGRPALTCATTQKVMATLMAVKAGGPLTFASGANHYRIGPGLEITRPVGTGINYDLILPSKGAPADHIVIDRDWVHGTPQDETTRGLYLSGVTYAAVVDSYFSDFHCTAGIGGCVDSQAIAGGLGDLPQGIWKITNNFLEASTENILFGGGVGTTIPADIEIRHNYMFKPLTWMPGQPGFVGGVNNDPNRWIRFNTPGYCPFVVKNLFELKNAQRVLFEGNILEYTWPGFTQHGFAIVLTALSQGGFTGNPNATVADITIRYNQISHAAGGVIIAEAAYDRGPPKLEARLSIHDDVFDDLGSAYYRDDSTPVAGAAFQISHCPSCTPLDDIVINHVTMLLASPKTFMVLGAPLETPIKHLTFTNNIISLPSGSAITGTGPKAPCGFQGKTALEKLSSCVASLHFEDNALIGTNDAWPRRNFFPRDATAVRFVNHNRGKGGDYRLSPQSPHKNRGTDGKDLGTDIDAVERAIAGVRVGEGTPGLAK